MSEQLLQRVPVAGMPPAIRAARDQLHALTGDASFVDVFANAPELLELVMQHFYANIFFGGRVAQRYKQLARLRLSMLHGCRTCNKQNVPGARDAGITDAQIAALDHYESGPFTDAEKAVLAYTDLLAIDNQTRQISPELSARLSAHFSTAEICELGVVAAFIAAFAKLSFVLDLVEKEDYCRFA